MTNVNDYLTELKRLDEAATDGPWNCDHDSDAKTISDSCESFITDWDLENPMSPDDADMDCMIAARNALSVLLKMANKALDLAADHETFNEFSEILDESEMA